VDEQVGRISPDILPPGSKIGPGLQRHSAFSRLLRVVTTLLVLALLIGGGFVLWQHIKPAAPSRMREVPQAVRTAPTVTGDMPIILNALGTVTPLATVTVHTQISGNYNKLVSPKAKW